MKKDILKNAFFRSTALSMVCMAPLITGCGTMASANSKATESMTAEAPVTAKAKKTGKKNTGKKNNAIPLYIEGKPYPCPELDAVTRDPDFITNLGQRDPHTLALAKALTQMCTTRFNEENGPSSPSQLHNNPDKPEFNPTTRPKARI